MDFSGKRIWVTGAGQGIGYVTAAQFAALGGDVVGLDKTFAASSYPFATVRLDVSERDQVQETCRALLKERPRLDVLVSAAGVLRELWRNFGDGVNQAADFFSAATSIPSRNVTPLTTFGN
ncbi:MAG: SDR family NAD(P)-dependent oxidoreductase [Methylocystis silviterrae]